MLHESEKGHVLTCTSQALFLGKGYMFDELKKNAIYYKHYIIYTIFDGLPFEFLWRDTSWAKL